MGGHLSSLESSGEDSILLRVARGKLIHPVFRVSMLKEFQGAPPSESSVLASTPKAFQPTPQAILAHHSILHDSEQRT
ncbi:hypothetical protein PIB30_022911 [Stylosanthes scabra]|uniref:Uncharacterized protein n=1 Tax=Stylosanthes scabra TaxID=79078 RepID=A0ABU6Z8Y4_9FABA|nr:hypothetical protein [Stylosanthes scabra]